MESSKGAISYHRKRKTEARSKKSPRGCADPLGRPSHRPGATAHPITGSSLDCDGRAVLELEKEGFHLRFQGNRRCFGLEHEQHQRYPRQGRAGEKGRGRPRALPQKAEQGARREQQKPHQGVV